jgi:hypothetical protein
VQRIFLDQIFCPIRCRTASASATKPPVMAAVRVPPSAWITSQSKVMVRSPSASKSSTARSARPIRRWISMVRPSCRPRLASRLDPGVGGARQHAVFGRHPAPPLALEKRRHPLLDAGGADHPGIAELHQHRAFGVLGELPGDPDRAQFVGGAGWDAWRASWGRRRV